MQQVIRLLVATVPIVTAQYVALDSVLRLIGLPLSDTKQAYRSATACQQGLIKNSSLKVWKMKQRVRALRTTNGVLSLQANKAITVFSSTSGIKTWKLLNNSVSAVSCLPLNDAANVPMINNQNLHPIDICESDLLYRCETVFYHLQ